MLHIKTEKPLPPISVLQATGWSLDLSVSGQSMEPLIGSGDTVTVKCQKPEVMKAGDVICFQENDGFVLHRLVEVSETNDKCFYEKGDAETRGHWIAGDSVLGILVAINDQPLDAEARERLLTFSQRERLASERLAKMNLSPKPSVFTKVWRKFKSAGRKKYKRKAS